MSRNKISLEIWEQIKVAHAAGVGLREVARNMNIPEGTVLARANREGWTQQIHIAKRDAQPVQSDAITPLQSVALTMQQRGQQHVQRIADVTERVLPHLGSMQPAKVLESIHDIEKYDRMARRNYGLSDENGPPPALSLRILTGQVAVSVDTGAP